jgi:hypothetical protein
MGRMDDIFAIDPESVPVVFEERWKKPFEKRYFTQWLAFECAHFVKQAKEKFPRQRTDPSNRTKMLLKAVLMNEEGHAQTARKRHIEC